MTDPLTLLLALVVGTLAVARASRLITADKYPPAQNLRVWWIGLQETRDYEAREHSPDRHPLDPRSWRYGWAPLLDCPFCFAPYAAAVDLTWALLAGLEWTGGWSWSSAWWVVNVWAAVSYVAAIVVARDEPPAEDA